MKISAIRRTKAYYSLALDEKTKLVAAPPNSIRSPQIFELLNNHSEN